MGNRDLDKILAAPIMRCWVPEEKPKRHPDEGREFAYIQPWDEYNAWQEYEKSKQEPKHEIVIDINQDYRN